MADKRISQLVDRGTVVNSDVVPIVVSGAVTTNKATISSIQTFMQGNLDLGVTSVGITLGTTGTDVSVSGSPITSSGNITINIPTASATNRGALSSADWSTFNSKVSSVGLSMPSAFTVSNSPITGSGTIAVTGSGTVSQYVRGDGSLADFPQGGGGGGSVSYYLNSSVSQGTIGGIAYKEMNKVPILGAGTDLTIAADGYIASYITDAGDPALLEIPAGNWNFETFFSASSGGGSPSFYVELYKVNSGGTATLIASNSATPELIAFGTVINPYFSSLAVPTTVLTITDRLALRYYVTHSGRTITLHTENSHLCQIITTFTTGLTALNGLTAQVQNFATGTSGTDFAISSATATHTFNLPTASATNRGALSSADWSTFNGKQAALNGTGFVKISGTTISYDNSTYLTTGTAASTYVPYTGAAANVDLGVYNLTSSAVNVNGSGSNAGVINLESNTIFPLVNGYGTIGSGTTNQFNFYQTTGAGVFRGAILSLNSIPDSVTRTYTLPNADGTLALSSDLGAYLPLAGGTLTGALNGTSAAFTGAVSGSAVTITATTGIAGDFTNNSSTNETLRARNNGSGNIAAFRNLSAEVASITNSGGLTLSGALNGTTGTFSTASGNNQFNIVAPSGSSPYITLTQTGTVTYAIVSTPTTGDFTISEAGFDARFRIAKTTGEATFSSSVQATAMSIGVAPTANILVVRGENATNDGTIKFGVRGHLQHRDAGNTITSLANDYNNDSAKIEFRVKGNTTSDAKMTILGSGNVGIGTASPNLSGGAAGSTILTVAASASARNAVLELNGTRTNSTDISGYVRFFNNGAATPLADIRAIRGSSDTSGDLAFTTAGTERMRITSGGYVKASTDGSTAISLTANYHEFIQTVVGNTNTYFYSTGATQTGANIIPVADRSNSSAYSFLTALSSGGGDTEFILRGDGNAYADGSWSGGGADYAEYFEWLDGNIDNEDRRGFSVSLINDKIKIAEEGDLIIGVISGNASVIGDSAWNMWNEKYLRDDFQTYIRDENGDRILNPNFDPDSEYVPREKRPEWGVVGLVGKLCIIKGQPTMPNWIKLKNISDTVEQWLIK